MRFATKVIRVAQDPDPMHGAVINPVYQSATFVWKNLDKYPKFDYTRVVNPNKDSLEQVLCSLEGAEYCVYVGSGMAAISLAFSLLRSGDHLLIANDIYGGTWRIAHEIIDRNGIEVSDFDANDLSDFDLMVKKNTKMLIFEGPTNPKLRMPDLAAVCKKAKEHGILTVFDNTFASPYLLNPLEYGVDIIVHSATKYINGHSDVIGGAVLTNDADLYDKFFFYNRAVGLPPSPFDTFLTLRGLKTLPVRMKQHCENAQAVAELLYKDPRLEAVNYPGLPSHPDYENSKKQLRGFGGMVSFELKGGLDEARIFAESTKIFLLAESLGGVESLVGYPWLMSHGCLTDEDKLARGIKPKLLRLSVGIEDIEDILADIRQALDKAFAGSKVAQTIR